MNSDNISLDQELADLKSTLSRLNASIEKIHISETVSPTESIENRKTAQQRLSKRYLRLSLTGLASAALLSPLLFIEIPGSFPMRLTLMIFFAAVMTFATIADGYLWFKVNDIDIQREPVAKVIDAFASLRRKHLIFQAVMIPFAIAFACLLCVNAANEDPSMIVGVIVGAIAGGSVGVSIWIKIMRDYRHLTE